VSPKLSEQKLRELEVQLECAIDMNMRPMVSVFVKKLQHDMSRLGVRVLRKYYLYYAYCVVVNKEALLFYKVLHLLEKMYEPSNVLLADDQQNAGITLSVNQSHIVHEIPPLLYHIKMSKPPTAEQLKTWKIVRKCLATLVIMDENRQGHTENANALIARYFPSRCPEHQAYREQLRVAIMNNNPDPPNLDGKLAKLSEKIQRLLQAEGNGSLLDYSQRNVDRKNKQQQQDVTKTS